MPFNEYQIQNFEHDEEKGAKKVYDADLKAAIEALQTATEAITSRLNAPLDVNGSGTTEVTNFPSTQNVQLTGSNTELKTVNNKVSPFSNPSQFTGFRTLETEQGWTDNQNHKAFSSIESGRNDELFLIYRSSPEHDSGQGNSGKLMITKSTDQGENWIDPIVFKREPETAYDTKDPSLFYDSVQDVYYVCYTKQHNTNTPATIKILRGDDPMDPQSMTEVTVNQPFSARNIVCHKPVKYGYYYYLPVYGDNGDGKLYPALLISTDNGLTWTVFFDQFTYAQGAEPTLYIKSNAGQGKGAVFYLLVRNHPEAGAQANLYASFDEGRNWSRRNNPTIGSVSGGPKVFTMDDYFMLIARDDSAYRHGYVSYSLDGENWSRRQHLLDSAPVYPEIAKLKNGRIFLAVSQERSLHYSKIQLAEMIKPPMLNQMNKRVIRQFSSKAEIRNTSNLYHPSSSNKGSTDFWGSTTLPMADVSDLKNFNVTVNNNHNQPLKFEIYFGLGYGVVVSDTQHSIVVTETIDANTTKRITPLDYPILGQTPGLLMFRTSATTAPTSGDVNITLEAERR